MDVTVGDQTPQRASVGAVGGYRDFIQLGQQGLNGLLWHRVPSLEGPPAGHELAGLLPDRLGRGAALQGGQGLHRLGHHRLQVGVAEEGRGRGDQKAGPAKVREVQARLGQDLQVLPDPIGLGGGNLHHLGEEQRLAGGPRSLGLKGFIENAFVGRVLVDEDQALRGLSQDIGVL